MQTCEEYVDKYPFSYYPNLIKFLAKRIDEQAQQLEKLSDTEASNTLSTISMIDKLVESMKKWTEQFEEMQINLYKKQRAIIDEQQSHINNLEQRIGKYEDEIDLLWPAWRESEARIEKLEQLTVAQSTEIAKLMKLAGVK